MNVNVNVNLNMNKKKGRMLDLISHVFSKTAVMLREKSEWIEERMKRRGFEERTRREEGCEKRRGV